MIVANVTNAWRVMQLLSYAPENKEFSW